eukprot:TRINITY_DN1001_c0_g1_i1.p1 TRINITY_DN1001_c0_g1~~TRINITY_DN1001_c0_g1_i1.p1  ORF type:complete len:164 (-),score=48.23 TRINITY_DN1001_c0_g1_i1:85-576(-)
MRRRPPRSTLSSSSAASDVYKRQVHGDQYNQLDLYKIFYFSRQNISSIQTLIDWTFTNSTMVDWRNYWSNLGIRNLDYLDSMVDWNWNYLDWQFENKEFKYGFSYLSERDGSIPRFIEEHMTKAVQMIEKLSQETGMRKAVCLRMLHSNLWNYEQSKNHLIKH